MHSSLMWTVTLWSRKNSAGVTWSHLQGPTSRTRYHSRLPKDLPSGFISFDLSFGNIPLVKTNFSFFRNMLNYHVGLLKETGVMSQVAEKYDEENQGL